MARSRIISQCEGVFVSTGRMGATGYMFNSAFSGPNGTGGHINYVGQLNRVQSANYGANITRVDVNQYGQLAALDRLILEAPTVSLSIDYLVANTYNAQALGLCVSGAGILSGILTKTTDEQNYFISTAREGVDLIGDSSAASTTATIGLGNGFITNFNAKGSVGNFATESVSIEALNFASYLGDTGLESPAIVPSGGQRVSTLGTNLFSIPTMTSGQPNSVSAIRPGDITLNLTESVFGASVADMKLQSYDISVPLSRTPLSKLGSTFPFSKEINFPIQITLGVEAEVGDLVSGDLSSLFCNDTPSTATITLLKPQCGGGGPVAVKYIMYGAKLESESMTSSIGANKKVSLNFVSTVGGPFDMQSNLYISGSLT